MFHALTTAVRLSERVGCFCVLTRPLNDDSRALHAASGFEDLPFDPARGIAIRIADLVRSGFGAAGRACVTVHGTNRSTNSAGDRMG
jgi:hypothetical protein